MNRKQVVFYFIYIFLLLMPKISAAGGGLPATDCDGCHGENGVSRWSEMPTIAGIDAFVNSEALCAYRDRARPCADSGYRTGGTSRPATDMCDVAASLSDEEIEALSDEDVTALLNYYASQQ